MVCLVEFLSKLGIRHPRISFSIIVAHPETALFGSDGRLAVREYLLLGSSARPSCSCTGELEMKHGTIYQRANGRTDTVLWFLDQKLKRNLE